MAPYLLVGSSLQVMCCSSRGPGARLQNEHSTPRHNKVSLAHGERTDTEGEQACVHLP